MLSILPLTALDVFRIPTVVILWYAFGIGAAAWVIYDTLTVNRYVTHALKVGWPIIVVFFSVVGLLLYLWTCRPPGIGSTHGPAVKHMHSSFVADERKKNKRLGDSLCQWGWIRHHERHGRYAVVADVLLV